MDTTKHPTAAARRLLAAVSSIALLSLVAVAVASGGGYSHDDTTGQTRTDWMGQLPDGIKLSRLSIPGTHDSGSYRSGGDLALTQSMSIEAQLKAGIRAFDIRLGNQDLGTCRGPELWILHGITCQQQKFTEALKTITQFLDDHPTETVLMRIKRDGDQPSDFDFEQHVKLALLAFPVGSHVYRPNFSDPEAVNPALGDVRKKIVILQNYTGDQAGIWWGSLNTQDQWELENHWMLAEKWWKVRDHFWAASAGSGSDIYVNFLSAAGKGGRGFPYFFASGHSSPGTNDAALLTGRTRGVINTCKDVDWCIDEFPDSRPCCLGTFSVFFKGINDLATDYINARTELTRLGIVFADFPGADLINAIIAVNGRIDMSGPTAPAGGITLPAPNVNGWHNGDVTVTWNWTDGTGGSGLDPAGCQSESTSTGEGDAVVVTGTCKDQAGNEGTASVTLKIDKTPPEISAAATTSPNGNGWYKGDVTVRFTCSDALSGIPDGACPLDQVLESEGAATASTAQTVTDAAGNTSDLSNVVTARIDKTPPAISAAATTSPNGNGWYNHDVTVRFTCNDAMSGIPDGACPPDQVLESEGAATASTARTVTDAAGNTSALSNVVTAKIDKTAPTVSVTNVTSGAQYLTGAVPEAGCATSDGLSGIATSASVAVTTSGSNGVGSFTATCSGAIDNAGNEAAPVSLDYTVVYGFGGFLPPLGKEPMTYNAGSTIPVKFVLTDAFGDPISDSVAEALAAAGKMKATLAGQGIDPVSELCGWESVDRFFRCNIKTPTLEKLGADSPYTITASEDVSGAFVAAPGVDSAVNPLEVFFK